MALAFSTPMDLPSDGAVGGVDIGWSTTRRTSAAARLSWTKSDVYLNISRFRAVDAERSTVLEKVFDRPLLSVAFDGPLTTGLAPVADYRYAERMLTSGFQPLIGKPGQSSSPNGNKLNDYATQCALSQVSRQIIANATHEHSIHFLAVVEAFPTSFLGVIVREPKGQKTRKKKTSDIFFELLAADGTLGRLLRHLLPGRNVRFDVQSIRNHDDRAALVCAISALCVAAGEYTTVGDSDGWIILPPQSFVQPWAREIFESNARSFSHFGPNRKKIRLGLCNGMYPSFTLEEFNSTDEEIAAMFYEDEGWEPHARVE